MVVRIRFGRGPKVERKRRKNRRVAMAFASFLTPAAVMAAALGIWRLAEDPHWASDFAIRQGIVLALAGVVRVRGHSADRRAPFEPLRPAEQQKSPRLKWVVISFERAWRARNMQRSHLAAAVENRGTGVCRMGATDVRRRSLQGGEDGQGGRRQAVSTTSMRTWTGGGCTSRGRGQRARGLRCSIWIRWHR